MLSRTKTILKPKLVILSQLRPVLAHIIAYTALVNVEKHVYVRRL